MQSQTQKERAANFDEKTLEKVFSEGGVSITINHNENTSVSIYRKDYESLLPYQWLKTQVIDLIIKLLIEQAKHEIRKIFASNQIQQQKHQNYVKSIDAFVITMIMMQQNQQFLMSLSNLQLFCQDTRFLLIPINSEYKYGQHWLLGLLQNGNHKQNQGRWRLIIFDSGSEQASLNIGRNLAQKLQLLNFLFTKQKIQISIHRAQNILYQSNTYDCGVYTIGFSDYILKQIIVALQNHSSIKLNRLNSDFKYLLGNSTLARQKYRKIVQRCLVNSKEMS